MEFQKLRLTGFKSFVEPTEFDILPGLTGVVGPNGCGKSNLLEALRWVMGATSAKALRAGGGMEDVIFAGTGTPERPGRPGRNWAEVSLQIANEDRSAPAEYNDHPTLEVTRRITRRPDGAVSTYRINGKEVRARDVQLLFADASTGANSPALVRQGQVSELINARPENRRKFLEEAAGITGLHQRRHDAELRLRAAAGNLERLDSVLADLEAQRATLARQARQATRYRNIARSLSAAEMALARGRLQEAERALDEVRTALQQAVADVEETTLAAASAGLDRERLADRLEPLRLAEAEAAAALHRVRVEHDSVERDLERAHADIARLSETLVRLRTELAREEALGSDAGEELSRLATESTTLSDRAAGEADELAAADAEVQRLDLALQIAEAATEAAQRALAEAEAEWRARRSEEERSARQLVERETALARATAERAQFAATPSPEHQLTEKQGRLAALQQALHDAEQVLTAAQAARRTADQAVDALEGPREAARARVNQAQAAIDTLTRMLAASAPEAGAVLDAISVEPGFETALAAALDDGLAASTTPEASRYWSSLGGETLPPAPLPAGTTPLATFVRAPAVLRRRLENIGVVAAADGPAAARSLRPGQRLVSREGDVWRWDGFVAAAGAKTAAALRLEQKRELAALNIALTDAFADRDAAEAALGAARTDRQGAIRQADEAQAMREAAMRSLLAVERDIATLTNEMQRRGARADALEQAVAAALAQKENAAATLAQVRAALQGLTDPDALRTTLDRARQDRDERRQQSGRARGRRADLRRDADARLGRMRQIAESRASWQKRAETARTRIAQVKDSLASAEVDLATAAALPAGLAQRQHALQETLDQAEGRRRIAADGLVTAQAELAAAERAARETTEIASAARELRARLEAQTEAQKLRHAEAASRFAEVDAQGGPAIAEDVSAELAVLSAADLERRIEKLKAEREALGAVNLCAEQEMQDIDARHTVIRTEKADCEAAIAKLRGAIGSLNRDGRQRLLTAFDRVNQSFGALFVQLFGGGTAELRLIDAEDPLEAGLEIFACPPGKKLTSLSLMSGGEQALTATALIFAVFKANPAPVCVLDEIDAPLDDANTDRFCTMLAGMAAETSTRFIAITHHPLTMSRMDRLFGVTMVERGVSQLVSIDLRQAEMLAA